MLLLFLVLLLPGGCDAEPALWIFGAKGLC
jgi:hypothetical protein